MQIGNAIAEKKVLDVLLQARDARAVSRHHRLRRGRLQLGGRRDGRRTSARRCDLEQAPLKYAGLSYTEIWISRIAGADGAGGAAGELAERCSALCAGEDVEAAVLGTFEATGRLRLLYQGKQVGRPRHALPARRPAGGGAAGDVAAVSRRSPQRARHRGLHAGVDFTDDRCCASWPSPNVCSKEWIIRQYDHEVQGGSVIKPLVGVPTTGPATRRWSLPVLGLVDRRWRSAAASTRAMATSTRTAMAAAAIDEAVRNVVAVGADPARIALLDNFCWGNTDRPEVLGSLVRAAEACRDVALAYGMPFISGKDSLNNEFTLRAAGTSSSRRRCSSAPWAGCPTCAGA